MSTRVNMPNQERALIFLHMPKAAGSTLRDIIQRQYDPTKIITLSLPDEGIEREIQEVPLNTRNHVEIIQGHMPFGLHKHIPQQCTYITILRDPVDRLISFYYYVLNNPDNDHYPVVMSHRMSLKDYIRSGLVEDNAQTRRLAGLVQVSKRVAGVMPSEVCSLETLEIAKKNLRENFSVVGLSERFDETLILIKRKFGWRLPCYVKVNVTKNRPSKESLSDSTLELLQQHTVLDKELFKYAQELFNQQINEQGIWLRIDLVLFKFLNTLYGVLRSFPPPFTRMMKSAHEYYKSISDS